LSQPTNNSIEIGNSVTLAWDVILDNLADYPNNINYTVKVLEAVDGASLQNSIVANIVVVNQTVQLNANGNHTLNISSQQLQAGKNYIWQVSFTNSGTLIESEWYNFAYKTTPADFGGALCSACDHSDLFSGIDVKPEHERFPPIAEAISIQALDELTECGENLRLVADFSNNPEIDTYHAIRIDGEKFVLRDDGQGADPVAGDGLFSIFLEEDIAALQEDLDSRVSEINSGERVLFKNRSLVDLSSPQNGRFSDPYDIPDIACTADSIPISDTIIIAPPIGILDHKKTLSNGVWTFGHLMRQMASKGPNDIATDREASVFALNWMNSFVVDQTVNGEDIDQRLAIQDLTNDWLQKSSAAGAPQGELKMEFAPFKLTAIVNRVDLRGSLSFEADSDGILDFDGGEGRFVFCALSSSCSALEYQSKFHQSS